MNAESDGSAEVRRLFHECIPQVRSGEVEIKCIARERGRRTILAVSSRDGSADPVGLICGKKGIFRVKEIVRQLANEKVSVHPWSESVERLIQNCLSPGRAERIIFDAVTHRATIYASPSQRSAITSDYVPPLGLLSRLVGWDLELVDA